MIRSGHLRVSLVSCWVLLIQINLSNWPSQYCLLNIHWLNIFNFCQIPHLGVSYLLFIAANEFDFMNTVQINPLYIFCKLLENQ